MADLLSLIRLRKHTVEEKQKILSGLYREAENLVAKKQAMEDQLLEEKDLARKDSAAAAFYGRYAENMRKKIEKMNEAIRKINLRIDAAREDVRAAFAEQKKIEIIQRSREEAERKAQNEKESEELDEIAIEGFRRKEGES
jgi:flagellar export protein FliJ